MPAISISTTGPVPRHHPATRPSISLLAQTLPLLSPGKSWRRPRKAAAVVRSGASFAQLTAEDEEWIKKLPDKKKPLYSHSLPCIEAWLRKLGFCQSSEDRAVWIIEKGDWHARLSLDVTDLYIRYLKSGPGNLQKDVERKFSYALSREDIESAVLGGP